MSLIAAHRAKEDAELLDVVNKQDEVIGQCPRGEFHASALKANGGLIRFAHIFIHNQDGQILLQQRSETKSAHPNLLDLSAAGHVGAGDDYETAAHREMQEEIGIKTALTPLFKREVNKGFASVFQGEIDNENFTLDPAEVKGVYWLTPDEIQHLFTLTPQLFAAGLCYSWPHYYTYLTTGQKPKN